MPFFTVKYLITCYEGESIDEKVRWICLEQSVELPEEVVPKHILDTVVGDVKDIQETASRKYEVAISWPLANVGNDRTQFLNILYGNISLKRGIKVLSVEWDKVGDLFFGPKLGIQGVRSSFGIHDRPLGCGVLKPMGLSSKELADQAYQFALGGLDMIKDDHGLADQNYAPFEERVSAVSESVQKAMSETGILTRYFPNITASGSKLMQNYELAADLGAEGVMLCPHLCGYEAMHELSRSELDLPIIAHPAFSGTLVTDPEHGFSPAFLYGELHRVFGADFTVYPNSGGRFSFTPDECHALNAAARSSESPYRSMFPTPGGGMKRESIPQWKKEYGSDTVFLLGASMLQHPEGIRKAAEEVQEILGRH